jgi:hypothetical protein
LIDDRLDRCDVGDRLLHVRHRDLAFFPRITVDRLLVGGFGLVGGALALVQGIGRLVEPRLRRVAMFGQLADAVIGLLRKITLACARSSAALRAAITSARVPA